MMSSLTKTGDCLECMQVRTIKLEKNNGGS